MTNKTLAVLIVQGSKKELVDRLKMVNARVRMKRDILGRGFAGGPYSASSVDLMMRDIEDALDGHGS